ncbi:MAG: response regulator transcription factor [Bacteroidetes bacterium]|nr:response regulator transcription factor [Bacteroidota bacterium]
MIYAIIVEDEKRSAKLLVNLLEEYCADVEVVGIAATVAEGFQLIKKKAPDVIFLDIEMQKETGFDLLNKFDEIKFEIIFTTAFENYALKAIKFCAIDYLLKPIDVDELKVAIEKVIRIQQKNTLNKKLEAFIQNMRSNNPSQFQIALPSTDGMSIVRVSEILYLKSDRQYTIFCLTSGEKILTSKNLGEYEELLLEHNFFRAHHSSLINLNEVKKYSRGEGGYALMSNGDQIDISKRKKEAFLKQFLKQ